jgi:hypothetical protein
MTFATSDAPNIQASGEILRNQGLNGICEPSFSNHSATKAEAQPDLDAPLAGLEGRELLRVGDVDTSSVAISS